MPASRRALPSSGPSTPTLPLRSFDGASSTSPSPQQYQAVLTPTRSSQELEFALIGRSLSHSHALSVILGASGRASSPTATVDWRPSTHHVQSQTSPLNQAQARTQEDTHNQDRKSELPLRLARWRRRRRRWRKSLFWVATGCVFAGCFALSFLAPWEFHTLAPIALGSGLSFVATLMVLLSFLTSRRFRRRPNELFAFVALSELGLATLSLVHILTMCSAKDGVCRPMGLASCSVATGLEMFLLLAGVGWFGAAILHLFVSVSNPFASYKRQLVLSHFLVWGISLLASVVTPIALFASRTQEKFQLSAAQICRNVALVLPLLPPDAIGSVSVSRAERLEQWQQLNLEFWGILVVIVVLVVVAAQFSLVVGWWRSNSGTVIALKARRRLMKRMAIYVHALNATWLVLLVLFFVYRSSANALSYVPAEGAPQPSDGRMDFLDALFHFVLTGKGFITGVVWISVNKSCCGLKFFLCGMHQCSDDDEEPSGNSASASSQSASLSGSSNADIGAVRASQLPLRSATVISMDASATQQTPAVSPNAVSLPMATPEILREPGTLRLQDRHSMPSLSSMVDPRSTSSSSSSSISHDDSTVGSWEISQNNETLQREIIYYTVCGITKAIIRSAERARASNYTPGDSGLKDDGSVNPAERSRFVETTLFVGAERDSTLANCSFISHVQRVTILTSPRAYCQPRNFFSAEALHRSLLSFDDEDCSTPRGTFSRNSQSLPRPTSFASMANPQIPSSWGQPPHLEHSHSQGSRSPHTAGNRLTASSSMSRSFNHTPGRYSLYPVSQVPFELFEQEIELQSLRSSIDEPPAESRLTRSAVLAGIRRTASSAFHQGRGVFRSRSGSTDAAVGRTATDSGMGKEFVPDDPKPKVFVDYAPREFRAIRLAFGLSDEKYLASFRTTAKERISAGSSGAFMFFSGDNSLLVKSLKEKECRVLVDMAPVYSNYLTANPHSRLIRFFGCHRVRLYGRNFYFAVMSNVLHSELHTATITEKYDVKGSWIDRRARRPQHGDRVKCAECDASYTYRGGDGDDDPLDGAETIDFDRASAGNDRFVPQFPFHVHQPDVVLKDLDLVRSLRLPQRTAEHLNAQIVSDCEFLRDLGIMDYSLLIGVHKCHLRAPRSGGVADSASAPTGFNDNSEMHYNSGTNLAPLGDDEVYFVGIIDILQQWDWEKQLEKAGKVLLGKSARGISAVAPAAYCRRFQARCTQILLKGSAPEDLDLDWEVDPNASIVKETKSRPDSKNVKEMTMSDLVAEQV